MFHSKISLCSSVVCVTSPRYDYSKKCWFNGKLDIWAFAETTPANKSCKDRPAGIPIVSPLSVIALVYRRIVCKNLLPPIKNK